MIADPDGVFVKAARACDVPPWRRWPAGLALFRATFFTRARLGLALAKCFLGLGFATTRFTACLRADLEALRALRGVVVFRFRTVALFFF